MGNLFNYDNKFFRGLSKVVDCMLLSALWVIFCIPVFTIGASTTALYYAAHKTLIRGKGYVINTFWDAFKDNFKKSTGIWMIQLVILIVLAGDLYITYSMMAEGNNIGVLFYVFLVLLVYFIIWSTYVFCYNARFELPWKAVMKNAVIFSVVHLPWSVVLFVLLVAVAFMMYVLPPFLFLMPAALYASYATILERKIFRKYMSEEDLKKELEDDRYDEQ